MNIINTLDFQMNNHKNVSRENLGMFDRPGLGSVSFRDSIQTASLFSYDNLSDGMNDNTTLHEETTEKHGALKVVRFITFYFISKF